MRGCCRPDVTPDLLLRSEPTPTFAHDVNDCEVGRRTVHPEPVRLYPPGYRGFLRFATDVGYRLAPFQRTIARAFFAPGAREVAACLPRSSAKSTLAALLSLHHVVSTPHASVYIGAAAREQARLIGTIVRRFAEHPAIAPHLTLRHDEIRVGGATGPTALRVIASEGRVALGWEKPTLMVGDEVLAWAEREPSLMDAMASAMVKNAAAKMLLISTAPLTEDSAWGRVRARALAAPNITRDGPFIEAHAPGLTYLEWSLPDHASADDLDAVKAANPAPWTTRAMLAEQRHRVSPFTWLALHCNRADVHAARWLPPGAWAACHTSYTVGDDEPVVLGVDIGGSRSASALVGVVSGDDGVRVAFVNVWQGSDAVLKVTAAIEALIADGRRVRELVYDPMRFDSEAQRLERALGLTIVEWPQSESRMTRCSENVHRLVVEQRLQHPGDPDLDRHAAHAIAKPTPRGWRLVKASDGAQIDALIALAMAAERAEQRPARVKFHGWLN